MSLTNKELAQRLDELESKADLIEVKHDNFERNTRIQLKQVFEAIRELSTPTETATTKRPIGFVTQEEKPTPKASAKVKGSTTSKITATTTATAKTTPAAKGKK